MEEENRKNSSVLKDQAKNKIKKEASKKLMKSASKKAVMSSLLPFLIPVGIVILVIVLAVGVATFLVTMPGIAMSEFKKMAYNISTGIADYFGKDSTSQVDEDQINILLDYLDNMGYDLKGYGFLTDYMDESDLTGNDYLDESLGVIRYDEDTNVDIRGETISRGADAIKKADSDFLFTYIVSDNYVYTVKNFNLNTESGNEWYDQVFSFFKAAFGRLADVVFQGHLGCFAEEWGKGMIAIYKEGGKLGEQGEFYQNTWWGLADNITVDYDRKVLKIKKGFFGRVYEYNLEGWIGRYGIPLDFLLSLQLGTMMPDLAFDIGTSFPTEVRIILRTIIDPVTREERYFPYLSKVVDHWYRDVYFVRDDAFVNEGKVFTQTDNEYEEIMKERWTLYETFDSGELNGEYKLYAINEKGEYTTDSSEIRNYDKAQGKFTQENGLFLFNGTIDDARELDVAVTKKAITKDYSSSEFEDVRWKQTGSVWSVYEEQPDYTLKQKGEGLRAETNPAIKMIFLYNTYFKYDGNPDTAQAITQLRQENNIAYGALDLTYNLSDGYDELERVTTVVEKEDGSKKEYSLKDVSGKVSLTQDSLNAFTMLENLNTLDADYIYRDFKELIVELGYFNKDELVEEPPRLLAWIVPEIESYLFPYRGLDKVENEFGTMIHSKDDIVAYENINKTNSTSSDGATNSETEDSDTDGGTSQERYKGYTGNEAVVSPVTGVLLEYGTYSENDTADSKERICADMKSNDSDIVDKVGYAKILVLNADYYKKLETISNSKWANNSLVNSNSTSNTARKLLDDKSIKSVDDVSGLSDLNKTVYGYKEFAENYEIGGIAGNIIYIDGFVCQDVDESYSGGSDGIPNGNAISIDDFKSTSASNSDGRLSKYSKDAYYKSISEEYTDKREAEEKAKEEAANSYMLSGNGEDIIFIKEGTILGRTMTDKELLEASYLRSGQSGTYEELRGSSSGDENKTVIGNYLRMIFRDKDDSIIENVEDYMDIEIYSKDDPRNDENQNKDSENEGETEENNN